MSGPYREDPNIHPPFNPWSFMRKPISLLWGVFLVWFLFVGYVRWFEYGRVWPALMMAAYWVPSFPFYYLACRWVFNKPGPLT